MGAKSLYARTGDTVRVDSSWMEESACLKKDPELFFPIGETGPALLQEEDAKAVCARCLARVECLQRALRLHAMDGVWGGMTARERRAYVRRMNRARGKGE